MWQTYQKKKSTPSIFDVFCLIEFCTQCERLGKRVKVYIWILVSTFSMHEQLWKVTKSDQLRIELIFFSTNSNKPKKFQVFLINQSETESHKGWKQVKIIHVSKYNMSIIIIFITKTTTTFNWFLLKFYWNSVNECNFYVVSFEVKCLSWKVRTNEIKGFPF